MNYTIEMGLGAVIYIPSLIKIGLDTQKLTGGIHRQTHKQEGDLISLLLFFQNKERKLRNKQLWVHVQFMCHYRNMQFTVKCNSCFISVSCMNNIRKLRVFQPCSLE
jgi:hypothetical protein